MARRPKAKTLPGGLPSEKDILDFVANHAGRPGKREIARAFDLSASDRIPLKRLLRDMMERGLLEKRGRKLTQPGQLPPVTVVTMSGRDRDGELLATPAGWDVEADGEPPRIIMIASKRAKTEKPAGVGDRVLARIEPDPEGGYLARPIKILGQRRARVLGIVRQARDGYAQIEPVDKKARGATRIAEVDLKGARSGSLVSFDLDKGRHGSGPARARVVEVLAHVQSEKAISLIALHEHDIPHVFSDPALAEAEEARLPGTDEREDMTGLPLITIDPADAKDHDDAVFAEPDSNPANPGGYVVIVAIADVAALVRPGSSLDREARTRGNSVYFPDRVVPMLPERISNDLCSLKEGVARPAMAVRMVFDANGQKRTHRFVRATMNSAARLAYEDAQSIADGDADEPIVPWLKTAVDHLWAAFAVLDRARRDREPLDLDLPERKIILKPDGTIDRIETPERLTAHRLVEEFMIQANVAAAETLEKNGWSLPYRVHDAPSLAKLEALRDFLSSLDLAIPKTGRILPAHFNKVLARVADTKHAPLVNEVVLRSQSQAEYAIKNYGHFGLNLRRYAHFTSPIRRYADLLVHRALIGAVKLGQDGTGKAGDDHLAETAASISVCERRAMAAERDTIDRLIATHLEKSVGASFKARIAGISRAGLFVRLDETGADGIVPMSRLDYDYFILDEASRAAVGERTGTVFQLGDPVEVRLVEAAPMAGALRFEMLSDGKAGAVSGKVRRGGRRGGKPARSRARRRR